MPSCKKCRIDSREGVTGLAIVIKNIISDDRSPNRVRCDVTLKLKAPLEATAVIEIDVHGDSRENGNGMTSAIFTTQSKTGEPRIRRQSSQLAR